MRTIIEGVGIFVLIIMLLVALCGITFGLSSFFGPLNADLDNKIFHNTAAYTDGMVRDLENLKMQYESGNDTQKAMLKATILHRFSIYPKNKLPYDLRQFLETLNK